MINDREMGIKVLKQREGVLGKVIINWNFDKMDFKSIYAESSSSNDFEGDSESAEDNDKIMSIE